MSVEQSRLLVCNRQPRVERIECRNMHYLPTNPCLKVKQAEEQIRIRNDNPEAESGHDVNMNDDNVFLNCLIAALLVLVLVQTSGIQRILILILSLIIFSLNRLEQKPFVCP